MGQGSSLILSRSGRFVLFKVLMRRFPVLSRFLIVLGFLATQAFAIAHATGHELQADKAQGCEICMLAHAAGGTPAAIDMADLLLPQDLERAQPPLAAAASTFRALPPSRGPPAA